MKTIEVDPRVPGNRDEFPSPQPSSALQELDSPSCQFKFPFSPKFTVLQEKLIVTITALTNHKFISFSAVQIYDLSYIHLHSSISTGILRTHNMSSSHADGLIAQSVEHCTGIAEVMGSNPVRA